MTTVNESWENYTGNLVLPDRWELSTNLATADFVGLAVMGLVVRRVPVSHHGHNIRE